MTRMHTLLQYLRVEDETGVVSVTNMACWTVLALLAVSVFKSGSIDLASVGGLIAVLAHYSGKKALDTWADKAASVTQEQIAKVESVIAKAEAAHDALPSIAAEIRGLKDRVTAVDVRTRAK